MVGFVRISSASALDDARDGFFKALTDSGYIRDSTITILERNAQGDVPALSLITMLQTNRIRCERSEQP